MVSEYPFFNQCKISASYNASGISIVGGTIKSHMEKNLMDVDEGKVNCELLESSNPSFFVDKKIQNRAKKSVGGLEKMDDLLKTEKYGKVRCEYARYPEQVVNKPSWEITLYNKDLFHLDGTFIPVFRDDVDMIKTLEKHPRLTGQPFSGVMQCSNRDVKTVIYNNGKSYNARMDENGKWDKEKDISLYDIARDYFK